MAFRTLVIGMIVLGLASGWMSHWIFPIVTTMAPDKEVVTSRGTQKCRTVRTVLDSKDAAPSCFSVIHEDLANGDRTYDEDGEESIRKAIENPIIQQQLQRGDRLREMLGKDRDEESNEAEPLE
ncbi:MAG: hypothetical protein JNK07_11400 [Alphaproteobacteria bacterium]|nr:hypothetical protein [Alphaproteobacteria bacterium]